MSDWGKILFWVLKTMPWVALLALVVFVLVPEDWVPEYAFEFRQKWRGIAFWSLLPVVFITLAWFYDHWKKKQAKRQEEVSTDAAIWRKFTRLHPKMQMLLIRLFFSGQMSETVRLKDPMVAALIDQGFLTVINGGMVTADNSGELVITVAISQSMLDFMEKHNEEFRRQADRIMSSGHGFVNRDR